MWWGWPAGSWLSTNRPPKRAGIGCNRYRSAYEFGVKAPIIKLVSDKKPSQNHHGLALQTENGAALSVAAERVL